VVLDEYFRLAASEKIFQADMPLHASAEYYKGVRSARVPRRTLPGIASSLADFEH
jgi:hypothetical protein